MLSVAAATGGRPARTGPPPRSRLAVLVPAHDEEALIGRCVRSLLAQSYPRELYRIVVIADNCTDGTARVAAAAGSEVMVRLEPDSRGKGQALRWAMDQLLAGDPALDALVVVDADSVADTELLFALEQELAAGNEVVQADYRLLEDGSSPRSQM